MIYKGKFLGISSILIATWLLAAGCSTEGRAKVDESAQDPALVASVNGYGIYLIDMDEALQQLVPSAIFHGGMTSERRAKYWNSALDMTIERELLYQEALHLGMKPDREAVEKAKQSTIERFGGKGVFLNALKAASLTEAAYEQKIERQQLADALIRREVDEKSIPAEDDMLAHFNAHKSTYNKPLTRRIRHVLVKVAPSATTEEVAARKKRAQEALDQLKAGVDFYDVAMNYSEEPYAVKGGDLGDLHKGRLVEEVDEAAWKLKVGELSGLIRTIYGFHIIRIDGESQPVEANMDDARPKIYSFMQKKRKEELKEALMSRLKAEAKVIIYKPNSND